MKHHKIIRIADEVGLAFSVGKGLHHAGFHSMQRNVGKQWGDDTALRGSARGVFKDPVVYRSSFEPCFDDSPQSRIGVPFASEGFVVDVIETALQVCI